MEKDMSVGEKKTRERIVVGPENDVDVLDYIPC
jgi:hypothetical protein